MPLSPTSPEAPPPTPPAPDLTSPSDPTRHVFVPVEGVDLPSLTGLPGVRRVADPVLGRKETTCVDTVGLALARAGVALRRTAEDGWLLDVPSGDGRDQVRAPGGPRPPKRLRDAVTAWVLDEELTSVASVHEATTSHPLLDGAGVELAVVTEHRLEAVLSGGEPATGTPTWREWSVRLREADVALLRAVDAALAATGAERVSGPRAATTLLLEAAGARVPRDGAAVPGSERTSGSVLARRLQQQLRELRERDSEVRRSGLEGVHGLRVALRRTRAALGTYGVLFDREVTEPVREELRWAARALGESRDSQVVEELLTDLLATEPSSALVGPVRRRVRSHFGSNRRSARSHAAQVLDAPRYRALVASLDRLVADPPWTEVAQLPAREVLPTLLLRDWKRLRRRVRTARRASEPETDLLLHDARKAAKRLRYAAETLQAVTGRETRTLARRARALQSLLGEHQDSVVARDRVRVLTDEAAQAGEPTFSYGRLDALLERQVLDKRSEVRAAARRIPRPTDRWIKD
jgi:CHAD domain-containing protein